MSFSSRTFRSNQKSIKSIGVVYYAAAAALLGVPSFTDAGTSTNLVGPIQAGTSDGTTTSDYQNGIYSANNPAATISFSGQTALRAFDTSPGITLLNPGTSIILHTGTNGAPVTYTAPAGTSTVVQLASSDFTSPDYIPDYNVNSPTQTSTASIQIHSAIRLEWHEQGSVDGEYDLINDQVGYTGGITGTPISVVAQRGPSVSNPTWINTNTFNGSNSSTINGLSLSNTSAANTYDPTIYNQATGVNLQGGQNRIQFSVGEYKTEGLSVSGTPSLNAAAGSPGYGLGNPALRSATTLTGLGVGGVRQQFQPATIVNESTNKIDPQTGQAYPAGPWNTAGSDNIDSTQFAVTAVGFSANPGTGLSHLNYKDAQWLETTGRLQNGAVFNYVSRTVDTGQRVVAALNTGVDPSWAVGSNDNGNTTATLANPNAGVQQHSIGQLLRFSGKTAGSEAEKTIASSRMGVGALSITETRAASSNAPVRILGVDFNSSSGASYTTDPSTFASINYDSIISDGVTPINYPGSPDAGQVVPRYQAVLISHYNTIKSPNLSFQNASAGTWAATKSFDQTTAETDTTPAGTVTGIKGDKTGDVAAFVSNILNSSGVGTGAQKFQFSNGVVSFNNPADNLYNNGYLIPALLNYSRTVDGGAITPNNYSGSVLTNQQGLQSSVFSAYGSLFSATGSAGAATEVVGSGAAYGSGGAQASNGTTTLNNPAGFTIAITSKDSSGNILGGQTAGPGGTYLFGNFSQNGVRDYSAVLQSVNAALSLYAVDQSKNSIFKSDGGVTNNTSIGSLVGTPGWITTGTNSKGDLITLGDYNGDGKFDGQDLYELAAGASLADSTSSNTLTATTSTFADALRNPNAVLRKNSALDYVNNYLSYTGTANASGGVAFLRKTAASVLTASTGVPRNATDLGTADPITGLEQFSYDPTGNFAFDKHDVNRDGVVDFNDALLVDQFSGQSYTNLNQQLAATEQTPVTGAVQSVSLSVVQQIDGESAIGSADLAELNTGLTGTGNTNWYGYNVTKTGTGTVSWSRTGGVVTVYQGAALQVSGGSIHVTSTIDPFTDSTATGTNTDSSVGVTVTSGGTLEYTSQLGSGVQIDRLASLNISSGGTVALDPDTTGGRSLLIVGSLNSTGKLDLGNNDLDVQGGSLATATAQATLGIGNGNWNGSSGLTSSAAASNSLMAIGVIQNNQSGSALFAGFNKYDGITPGAGDILAKFTYFGDANLDGKVDGSDYSQIDNGFLHNLTSWFNGDFNYDGTINGSDYTLIDNAYNSQGTAFTSAVANPTVGIAAEIAPASGATSVPEPAALSFLTVVVAGTLGRRRRR